MLLECLLLEQKVLEMRSISLILEERLLTLVMSHTAKQVIEEDLKRLIETVTNQAQGPKSGM